MLAVELHAAGGNVPHLHRVARRADADEAVHVLHAEQVVLRLGLDLLLVGVVQEAPREPVVAEVDVDVRPLLDRRVRDLVHQVEGIEADALDEQLLPLLDLEE